MSDEKDTKLDWQVRALRAPAPWQAFVIPVSGFPIPEPECRHLSQLIGTISKFAAMKWTLSSEVFFEFEQMPGMECRYRFSDNGREWLPQIGLGVWPDRDPPDVFTPEELENWVPGTPMRELLCEVFRVSTSSEQRRVARDAMFTFGSVVEILVEESSEAFFQNLKPVYLDFIKSRMHRCFPYYVPLLEGKTFENMKADELNHWCPGVSVYIRESFQDQGILVASRLPLSDAIEGLPEKIKTGSK